MTPDDLNVILNDLFDRVEILERRNRALWIGLCIVVLFSFAMGLFGVLEPW